MKTSIFAAPLVLALLGGVASADDSPAEAFGRALLEAGPRAGGILPSRFGNAPTIAHQRMADRAEVSSRRYTHHEIIQILAARGTDNPSIVDVKMDQLDGVTPRPASHISSGETALATELKLNAQDHTLSELAKMKFDLDG